MSVAANIHRRHSRLPGPATTADHRTATAEATIALPHRSVLLSALKTTVRVTTDPETIIRATTVQATIVRIITAPETITPETITPETIDPAIIIPRTTVPAIIAPGI